MLCGCFPLAIYFTFGSVYMSMPLSHFVPASPSPSPCPQVHSLHLRLYSCPAKKIVSEQPRGRYCFLLYQDQTFSLRPWAILLLRIPSPLCFPQMTNTYLIFSIYSQSQVSYQALLGKGEESSDSPWNPVDDSTRVARKWAQKCPGPQPRLPLYLLQGLPTGFCTGGSTGRPAQRKSW